MNNYSVNVKLRINRKVVDELIMSKSQFIETTNINDNKQTDLDGGYKGQGYTMSRGHKITFVASKVWGG